MEIFQFKVKVCLSSLGGSATNYFNSSLLVSSCAETPDVENKLQSHVESRWIDPTRLLQGSYLGIQRAEVLVNKTTCR